MVVKRNETLSEHKQPVQVYRSGQVKGSIWENESKDKTGKVRKYYSVSVIRSYTDVEGNWNDTNSYTVDSLADLELVAKSCREFVKLKTK